MKTNLALLFVLIGLVLALLVWCRWRYDLIAFGALIVAVLTGLMPTEKAFSGFGHEATVIVALVLIDSRGLVSSGVIQLVTRSLMNAGRPLASHIAMVGGISALSRTRRPDLPGTVPAFHRPRSNRPGQVIKAG